MLRYVLRRLAYFAPVFLGATVLVFVFMRAAPGDAARFYLKERGIDYSEDAVKKARHELALDRNIAAQYGAWLLALSRGDMGRSRLSGERVKKEIASRFRVTLMLAALVFPAVIFFAFPFALFSAVKQNQAADFVMRFINVIMISIPSFALGLILITIFSVRLHILPSFGFSHPVNYIMPCATIVCAQAAYYTRFIRVCLAEELSQDYVLASRSRGIPAVNIVLGALKGALFPVISALGMSLAFLLGGQAVVEKIFGIPGMGSYLIDGVMRRDYAVVQGCALYYAALFSVINLTADILCAALNPQSRLGAA